MVMVKFWLVSMVVGLKSWLMVGFVMMKVVFDGQQLNDNSMRFIQLMNGSKSHVERAQMRAVLETSGLSLV